jgi:uncharacterized protein (UPF0335 family)
MSDAVAADQLRLHIEAIERLEEEKKALAEDIKDRYALAKSDGFDTKTIREIVKLRKMEPDARREREALLDTYKAALGMLDGTPLGKWALERLKPKQPDPEPETPAAGDDLYAEAVRLVTGHQKASTSWLQRQLRIGYNSAAGLIERLETAGIVSKPDNAGKREVLVNKPANWTDAESPASEPEPEASQPEPELTVEDARNLGTHAAQNGMPVTSNPFPAYDERRAAWDEAWCAALGSDGMDIPDALKPTPKPKKSAPKPDDGQ